MHKLTNEYKLGYKKYEDFKLKAEVLIRELLVQNEVNFHKIESRTKGINKLDEKIYRKNQKYKALDEITDLVGLRIITYLEDEVDKVAEIIRKEFELDDENSIDKRKLESDRFGYKSLHYVVTLTKERKKLTEYKRFKNIKIEIQIRSILQHAWAEIEHDIGYKSEQSIPDILKRNFYRVAALLETADIEFVNIKKGLNTYEETIDETIKTHPEDVEINAASLKSFILSNKLLKQIDEGICKNTGCKLMSETETYSLESHVDKLHYLNIDSIKDLETILKREKDNVVNFASEWVGNAGDGSFERGISLFYLCYLLVGKTEDIDFANKYYSEKISKNKNNPAGKEIIDTYKKIK
ncbi:(p)ppGpp synthetase [Oceanihabitans sp. 2_MG-2023]|uniref:GTP pyrophosphokinase n=1 Tax=Oceanihabitans sp. 2_MG-2023 TaxID=3062661 RepID=UPI0026E1A66D|nr:(p)ppGpp synthetase [Oceanihabitans sp. 2_MG-2023]MDO6598475.1 (p)ppGpp synthetase [Oceanihabitans sp. 2_MG-2023]